MIGENDEVLERITPSAPRRYMAVGCLGLLGIMLLVIAASRPPSDFVWLIFLVVLGAGSIWLSWSIWTSSATTLELTRHELREQGGRLLARIEEVKNVDRGFFAFKPAAGFRLSLTTKMPNAYAPGLWWRRGRMVMIGGVTSSGQSKSVADLIAVLVAQQRGEM